MVALTKPSGGTRAFVMGDVCRRLVSRTCAQQAAEAFQAVCAPFQYALSTKAGPEALRPIGPPGPTRCPRCRLATRVWWRTQACLSPALSAHLPNRPQAPWHSRKPPPTYNAMASLPRRGQFWFVVVALPRPSAAAFAWLAAFGGGQFGHNGVFLRDMNVGLPLADSRRIEVLANGLPFWQGAQVAVDTTLVCPLTRSGEPRPGAERAPGLALQTAANRKRRAVRRGKLVVLGRIGAGNAWVCPPASE